MTIDERGVAAIPLEPEKPAGVLFAPWLPGAITWLARHELWVLAAAAPFLLFPNRWTPLVFALIPLTWLCRRIALGQFTLRTSLDAPVAVLVVMSLVGYAVSADPSMSGAKVWGMILQAAIFYGLVNGVRTQQGILRATGMLLVATVALALVSLVGADWSAVRLVNLPVIYDHLPRLIENIPGSGVPRASELFNPREVGATMGLLLPLPIAFLMLGRQKRLRLLSIAALGIGFVILLLSQSLQALLGVALALLLIAVWRNRWFLVTIPGFLIASGAGLLVYGPQRAAETLLSPDHVLGIGVVLRLDIWSRALAMVTDMPYTGVGLNTFPLIQTGFYPGYLLGAEPHAHNLFLQTAVDLGLPGLAGLLGLLVAFALTVASAHRATSDPDRRAILVGLAGGVLAYAGNGLVDTVTLGAKPLAVLWIGLGLAAACLIVSRRESWQVGPSAEGLEGLKVEAAEHRPDVETKRADIETRGATETQHAVESGGATETQHAASLQGVARFGAAALDASLQETDRLPVVGTSPVSSAPGSGIPPLIPPQAGGEQAMTHAGVESFQEGPPWLRRGVASLERFGARHSHPPPSAEGRGGLGWGQKGEVGSSDKSSGLVWLSGTVRPRLVVILPMALLLVLLVNAFVAPASVPLNLAAIGAHKTVLAARSGDPPSDQAWSAPEQNLREALMRQQGDPQAYDLLGTLLAWQGDYPAAIQALEQRAALDAQDPMGRYAPFEALRRGLLGEQGYDRWDDLLRVYSQWKTRFPDRAETYAQIAVVWDRGKGDPAQAAAVLQSGLDKRAEPQGLLTYYLGQVQK